MNNGGFLSTQSVRENQLANLSKQIDDLKDQLQQKENIIKEIEKYCNEEIKKRDYAKLDAFDCARLSAFYDIYEKLQELKGSESNE